MIDPQRILGEIQRRRNKGDDLNTITIDGARSLAASIDDDTIFGEGYFILTNYETRYAGVKEQQNFVVIPVETITEVRVHA